MILSPETSRMRQWGQIRLANDIRNEGRLRHHRRVGPKPDIEFSKTQCSSMALRRVEYGLPLMIAWVAAGRKGKIGLRGQLAKTRVSCPGKGQERLASDPAHYPIEHVTAVEG
jgi:hypothetical protein